jgi:hypothetical protein
MFTLFSRGWGMAIAPLTVVCLLLTQIAINAAMHDGRYYTENGWPKLLGFCVAALCLWMISMKLSSREKVVFERPGFGMTDELPPPQQNSLFFVDLKYWPVILLVAGIVFYFV